jgi:hydroxymethylbilane synthase
VDAERAVLAGLDGGCAAPVGVHASVSNSTLRIRAIVYSTDGRRRIGDDRTFSLTEAYAQGEGSGNGADTVDGANPISAQNAGFNVARRLLDRGAAELVPRESTP